MPNSHANCTHTIHTTEILELQLQCQEHTVRQQAHMQMCGSQRPPGTPGGLPKKGETGKWVLEVRPVLPHVLQLHRR